MSQQESCLDFTCVEKCCNALGYCPNSGNGPTSCAHYYSDLQDSSSHPLLRPDQITVIVTLIIIFVLVALLVCFFVWMYRVLERAGIFQQSQYTWNDSKQLQNAPKLGRKKESEKELKEQERVGSSKDLKGAQGEKEMQDVVPQIESYLKQDEMKDQVDDLKASGKIRRIKKKKSLYLQEQVIIQKQNC